MFLLWQANPRVHVSGPKESGIFPILLFLVSVPLTFAAAEDPRDAEIRELKAMIRALEARVEALESQDRAPPSSAMPERLSGQVSEKRPMEPTLSVTGEPEPLQPEEIRRSEEPDGIQFRGALRYNVVATEGNLDAKRGESGLDVFRIGAEGSIDNFLVSAEYRFYSYMNTLKHGWIGYDFPDAGTLKIGVSQVPFGILPYASHSWWFGIPYYVGLEDDYDLGIQYEAEGSGPWDYQVAFYKNEELGDATNLDRYSIDLVRVGDQQNEEVGQVNLRGTYTLGAGTDSIHEFGLSLQAGEMLNNQTEDFGYHWAGGLHLDSRIRRWNFQLQLVRYEYHPENPPAVSDASVEMGAYAGSFAVASEGTIGVANIAYNVPIEWPWLDSLLIYNNFSVLDKDESAFNESVLNTTGAAFGKGPLFLYLDLIQAKNMLYFEEGSLAGEGNDSWDTRLNFNIGYYW